MPVLLAIETSTEAGSVALWRDGVVLDRDCTPGVTHSETLLPLVRSLLAEAGVGLADLDGIAFGAGPGSFTGLRVACGVAQGLAVAAGLPLLPVGTLEAMAWTCRSQIGGADVAVYLDARMNEVYCGLFGADVAGAPVVVAPAAAPLPAAGAVACGNGLSAYPVLWDRVALTGARLEPAIMPNAAAVAALAAPRFARGEGIDPAFAAPAYIRDKVALTVAERLAQGGKA